ncbi:MAG: ATP-binding protein [Hespellia sp.]|nr:ATP-binding protein [Hespellia sp.]
MNSDILKTIIYDQHQIIRDSLIINREYTFEKNGNYILTGLRRAGKSTLLYKIARELVDAGVDWSQIIYINFEDERLLEFQLKDFNDILLVASEMSEKKSYFFLDEIQNVAGWESFVRRIADAKERVYITGSNAQMLSRDMEARLGGRYFTKYISPYNFREYLIAKDVKHDEAAIRTTKLNGRIRAALGSYFYEGGFPESLLFQAKREYVENIYQKILLGDIVARNSIRNSDAMRILMKKIAETVMHEVSYTKLKNIVNSIGIKISKDSLINYIGYAEDAYLIFHIQNYVAAFVEKESVPKYYFNDNGLLNLFLTKKDSMFLENMVAVSLYNHYRNELYYFKSSKVGIDIDFYISATGTAIQVAYSIQGEARIREVGNLIKIAKEFSESKRYMIVTYEEEEVIEEDGVKIEVIPLYKFLLK